MNRTQAHVRIDQLPEDADDIVIIRPREARKQCVEKDGVISFRVPKSQKVAIFELFDRVAAKIGSQRREDVWDFILSEFTEL